MDRVNCIYKNEMFQKYLNKIEKAEIDRIYCHHDINHFIDVARIGNIIAMEENIDIDREMIYAAAILHDIGRFCQYETGRPHEEASAELAVDILDEAGFTEDEIGKIVLAIREHGNASIMWEKNLTGIIYRADKLSRKCYSCKAQDTCHKALEKRNLTIKI